MLAAYMCAAEKRSPDPVEFWADKLDLPRDQMAQVIGDAPKFQNMVRLKLMKRGGVGYVQPSPESFPTVEAGQPIRRRVRCIALLRPGWMARLPENKPSKSYWRLLIGKGVVALNIIPDRNWNIADPETRRLKVQKLHEIVRLAEQLALPLNIGTEMNAFGQKPVDDFDAPELAPVRQAFLDGAYFIYGHTVLQRALGLGYQSEWAQTHLPFRRERNKFYTQVGHMIRRAKSAWKEQGGLVRL